MDGFLEKLIDDIKNINSDIEKKDDKAMLSTDEWESIFSKMTKIQYEAQLEESLIQPPGWTGL